MIFCCSTTGVLLLTVLTTIVLGLQIDSWPTSVEAGKTYTITYSPKDKVLGTASGGSFSWTVSRSLPSATNYGLQISGSGETTNFSAQFPLTGGSSGAMTSVVGGGSGAASSALAPVASSALAPVRSILVSSASPQAPSTASSPSDPRSSSPTLSSALSSTASSTPIAASSGTSGSTILPASSTVSTSAPASPTSLDTISGGSSQGGLTTGEKAGIGVGVSIGGLLLALGAFFLGMSARKKSNQGIDIENGSVGGKPELDGKAAYHHKMVPDVESGMIPVEARRSGDSVPTVPKAFELGGELGQPPATHPELAAEPRGVEIDSSDTQQPRHELHSNVAPSSVSPMSELEQTGPTRRDTYDDPRLVQNPWAQDDGRQQR
ncbi:hypothetical protein IQ06DRAFT_370014 [Phaeosphaeriaceae sp. SRC1lsM3a]|nr:hypothetical protein IQ06DRAFT_370014 [Stagonospora sp. SRC1lsM3a]